MKTKYIPLLALGAALLAGCASDHGAYVPQNTNVNDLENSANFVLLDSGAQHSVTSSGIQENRLPDGRLEVIAHIRNRENRRIQVQVNCEFKDSQGFVVDSTPFQNFMLDENAQQDARFVSMNTKAEQYTVRVRQAR